MNRIRQLIRGLVLGCALVGVQPTLAAAQAIPAEDGPASVVLRETVEHWATAAGGWPRLARLHGTHLKVREVTSGIDASTELWVTRDGLREVTAEGPHRAERVRNGSRLWTRDWNGKTLEAAGRDRSDGITEAFLYSLVYAGFSATSLRAANATDGGADSSRAFRVLHLAPLGGIACDLFLDVATGLPARATRTPYDDELSLIFGDWRSVDGVKLPFHVIASPAEGTPDTLIMIEANPSAEAGAWSFARPRDGASDVRWPRGLEEVRVPFNFENDHIMVDCRVNGRPPMWFMFDTGADVSLINSGRLAELGLTAFGASETSGGGNSTATSFTRVARLQVGAAELVDQRNTVMDMSGLEHIYGMPLAGILGYDFASRFVIDVDYDSHTFGFHLPDARLGEPAGARLPFVLEAGHPHVRGSITVDDAGPIGADFIIDSGAAESANLTAPFVRTHRLLERARKTPAPAPSTMAGSEKQFFAQTSVRGRLRELKLGETVLTSIPVNLQQGAHGVYASASFSGTIGQRILQRFNTTYDYPRSQFILRPNAEYAKPFPPRMSFGMTLLAEGADYTSFKVTGVRKDSPAMRAGFKTGDVIASLDGKPASQWRLAGIRAALAAAGSQHTAEVTRGAEPAVQLAFTVELFSIEGR